MEKNETLKCFADRRKSFALNISDNCFEKGESIRLTKRHFEVKLSIYDNASKNFDKKEMKIKYLDLIDHLKSKDIEELDPMDFQCITGEIEAIGELIIKQSTLNT